MFRLWPSKDPTNEADMGFAGVEDGLSEEELRVLERGGARIYSSHHRPAASALSSATSSAASVVTGGSAAALVRPKRPIWRAAPGHTKERNLLLGAPRLVSGVVMPAKQRELDGFVDADAPVRSATTTFVPQVLAAISVSLGSMIVGFASSYSSPAIPSMRNHTGFMDTLVQPHQESWIGSLMPLFAIFGGMMGGPAIDFLGRRTTILFTAVPFLVSFLLIGCATMVEMVYVGRSIAGFCTGIITLALPVYLGETIQSEVRGVLGLLPTTVGNLGILLCFLSGKYLAWTQLALLGATIPVPFILCMMLIPETPRWYVSKGRGKRARRALQWLRGRHTDVSTELAEIEKSHVESQLSEESVGLGELFSRRYRRPLLISMGLMFFQQMSGINAVMFYMKEIFQATKSSIDEDLGSILVALVNLVTVFVSSALIDRLGRKILLYVSSIVMAIMISSLGVYFYFKERGHDVSHLGWVPLAAFIVYIVGFSIGFGPIPWLMMGEILPAKIRGSAASVATSFNWLTTFVITKTFKDFGKDWGFSAPFLVYGASCLVALVFVLSSVPETQGKSLEDIERNLTGEGPKIPVRTARRMSSIANLKPTPVAI